MINIITERINTNNISNGIYLSPEYIPYINEYKKHIRLDNIEYDEFKFISSIQLGYIPDVHMRVFEHITKWLPHWFRPMDDPFESRSNMADMLSTSRNPITSINYDTLSDIIKTYPVINNMYPISIYTQTHIALTEVFDDYYTITSNQLFDHQFQSMSSKYCTKIDYAVINNKKMPKWTFSLC